MAKTTLLIAAAALALATTAQAQTTNRIVEPVPQADVLATIDAPVEYDENGVIKAQHFKAGDLTDAQYQALLAEADRIRAYQSNQGQYTGISYEAAVPQTTTIVESAPAQSSYEIELFEAEPVTSPSVTYATAPTIKQPAQQSTLAHKVIKGDTLYSLSKRYRVSINALQLANNMSDNNISLGQVLTIPSAVATTQTEIITPVTPRSTVTFVRNVEPVPGQSSNVYAVLPKDTLYGISRRACVSVGAIIETNGITDPNSLKPGQRLTMPTGHCLN